VKNRVKKSTLYAMAFLLFFFGNAVNVIHFCCDVCRVHGTEVFTENSCHEQSTKGDQLENDGLVASRHDGDSNHSSLGRLILHLTHSHEICSLNRVSITLDELHKDVRVWLAATFIDLIPSDLKLKTPVKVVTLLDSFAVPLSGRTILNRICVLRN
jgi:hypothetical protein